MIEDELRRHAFGFLDRAAATPGPFWESDPAELLASLELMPFDPITIDVDTTTLTATISGEHHFGALLMLEAALAELADHGVDRHSAVFAIRERVSVLPNGKTAAHEG